ncbi:putative cyclase [Actinoplanes missouriensis 431]|uniref:Putative cyclase n=1 Tax=Actinoplanes missouriensis (strain ATCC 14538 / DSM 43046 / CBS 188.64 / JCM 3121 / NBRC 102363 / NCIMB 12654 / NRRL B-3342 / UNCC 431) TaxID=512565 RepID=I0H4R4_ACTM4|nr:cyclase family protein [Actinoplanes missouriensis]BAL88001.1 putative cyclase [Actinoplanes missouriensis 431]
MRVRRIVDLSVPVGPQTQVYPGDPVPRLTTHATVEADGFNLLHLDMGSQTGTHVDAPFHFDSTAPRLHELDLALFTGRGVVLDVRGLAPRAPITWDLLDPAGLGPGVIALICTGWSAQYGTPGYFDHPYLDAGACRRMLDLGVRTFAIDAINIDETPSEIGYPVHHLIARAGGVIGENLRGLERVDFPDPLVSLLPIALENADGAPVRAVAMQLEK